MPRATVICVRMLAALPILTALLTIACALWQPIRRFIWPVLALAALNLVLTTLTSGEWSYQRVEESYYRQAVASGNFSKLQGLLADHDPHLLGRMMGLAPM